MGRAVCVMGSDGEPPVMTRGGPWKLPLVSSEHPLGAGHPTKQSARSSAPGCAGWRKWSDSHRHWRLWRDVYGGVIRGAGI